MTSIRSARAAEGKFTQIANRAIRDERISPLASHIVAFVLSYPPDHHFTQDWLRDKLLKRPGVTAHAIKTALKELERYGYYVKHRTSQGRGKWVWDQVITDDPDYAAVDNPGPEAGSSVNPPTDEPTCDDAVFPQVSSSVNPSSDDRPADKRSNTGSPKTKHVSLSGGSLADMLAAAVPDASEREIEVAVDKLHFMKAHGEIRTTERAYTRRIIDNGDAAAFVAACQPSRPAEYTDADYRAGWEPAPIGHDGEPCKHGSPGGGTRNQYGMLRCPLCRMEDAYGAAPAAGSASPVPARAA